MKRFFPLLILSLSATMLQAQVLKYTDGKDGWNSDSLGNHRVVVRFNGSGNTARVIIPWRRRDSNPQLKRIIIQDAKTGMKVMNIKSGIINNESGDIYFEPVSGNGLYYVYYLPSRNEGRSNYPTGTYLKADTTASASWLKGLQKNMKPNASAEEIQSVNEFNSFYPMEVIATAKETNDLIKKSKRNDYLVFPEDRQFPIKMNDHLPYRWAENGLQSSFKGIASKGEFYVFQLGIYAIQSLDNITIQFSDLKNTQGQIIKSDLINCFNAGGTDYTGKPFSKTIHVDKGKVQALWCGLDLPTGIASGVYQGTAIIKCANASPATISIILTINNETVADGGISEPWKQTRLKWLNSTLAQDNTLVAPYTSLQLQDKTISLLGRKVTLNEDGLPAKIQTFFTPEMTGYQDKPNEIIAEPIRFHFIKSSDGKELSWKPGAFTFTNKSAGTISWTVTSLNEQLQMDVSASIEFDGFMAYTVKVTALDDIHLSDIALDIPFSKNASRYLMGLGHKGGFLRDTVQWKWNVDTLNQDGAWLGNVNAGLQYSLKDEHYVRPLNTNFYLQKPLLLPASWGNGNKGGINIGDMGNSTIVHNYSGERSLKKGDVLYYNFNLLITPFHTINTDFQWENRFYHRYNNLDSIKAAGATVVNIHHATPINPWINYPFIEYKKMKDYIDRAHNLGLKVKIYNTVRELSNHAYETFPMRSLGHEIYSTGKGGGFSWLQEHIGEDYIAAWFVPEIKDAALVNSGMSRWHNYYVEGMNWLTRNVGIDGIYLDDVAFDRVTMKRIKRVLTQDGHPGIIDLHSANQFNKNDGFNNSANLYMEHFPYLNRLWFGEYFDYEKNDPDFFLTEVSGIPFGLMGEMLQDDGNPWRGMVYGMTSRMSWSEKSDPGQIWNVWDKFGMKGSEMIGYWSDNCPVKTSFDRIKATVYKKKGSALVSVASWEPGHTEFRLKIDWRTLGMDPAKATIHAPAIRNFQPERTFSEQDLIPVENGKGWILIIEEK
jgi:hypothetical protein